MKAFLKNINFCVHKYKRWILLLIQKKNRNVILKRAKDYFYNNVETIRKNMRDKYKNLSEEEREKIKKYKKNCRKKMKSNITAEKKEKIKEYQKKNMEKTEDSLIIRVTVRFTLKIIIFI